MTKEKSKSNTSVHNYVTHFWLLGQNELQKKLLTFVVKACSTACVKLTGFFVGRKENSDFELLSHFGNV